MNKWKLIHFQSFKQILKNEHFFLFQPKCFKSSTTFRRRCQVVVIPVRVLRNIKVFIYPQTPTTKYYSLNVSYFSYTFLNSISIEIYKLYFVNFLSFLKEDTNNIYYSIILSFSKYNLTLKNYTSLKALS